LSDNIQQLPKNNGSGNIILLKKPRYIIGDQLEFDPYSGKEFLKSATINFIYYKNYCARLACDSG